MIFCLLLYDEMEPIDLAPFGVLSMARRIAPSISVTTIADVPRQVRLANGLKVVADHGFAAPPALDVLIVGGGAGWIEQSRNSETLDFIRRMAVDRQIVSVCTGAMILAAAGILSGRAATTKREVAPPETSPLEILRRRYPDIVAEVASVVDEGTVVTGGGVTLCIDATLYVIGQRLGEEVAAETARIIEYARAWKANREALPVIRNVAAGGNEGGGR